MLLKDTEVNSMAFQFSLVENFDRQHEKFPFYIYCPYYESSYYKLEAHWHEEVELWYCLCDGVCRLDATEICFKKGDIIIVNKGVIHSFRMRSKEKIVIYLFDYRFLSFFYEDECETKFIHPLIHEQIQLLHKIDNTHSMYEELCKLLQEIEQLNKEKSIAYTLKIKAHLYALLYLFYYHHAYINCQEIDEKKRTQIQVIRHSLRYMEENLHENITVDKLANISNLSKYYYIRLFKMVTKQTPMEYLTNLRLNHAKRLLKEGDKTITQVSYDIGFHSPGYFARQFKKKFDITPTEYKIQLESELNT